MLFYGSCSIIIGIISIIYCIINYKNFAKESFNLILTILYGALMISTGILGFIFTKYELVYIIFMLSISALYAIYMTVIYKKSKKQK